MGAQKRGLPEHVHIARPRRPTRTPLALATLSNARMYSTYSTAFLVQVDFGPSTDRRTVPATLATHYTGSDPPTCREAAASLGPTRRARRRETRFSCHHYRCLLPRAAIRIANINAIRYHLASYYAGSSQEALGANLTSPFPPSRLAPPFEQVGPQDPSPGLGRPRREDSSKHNDNE